MKTPPTPEERKKIDYLLGRLPPHEREEMTARFLGNDATYRELLETEENLIDSYARNDLDPEDARALENTLLLTHQGRIKLRTAEALLGRQREIESLRRRTRWIAAAAAIVIASGIGYGVWTLRQEVSATMAVTQSPPLLAVIHLPLEVYRDASAVPEISLPSGSGPVAFTVPIAAADRGSAYEVRLRIPNGAEQIASGHQMQQGSAFSVSFTLQRQSLPPGRYEIEVSATQTSGKKLIAFGAANFR